MPLHSRRENWMRIVRIKSPMEYKEQKKDNRKKNNKIVSNNIRCVVYILL